MSGRYSRTMAYFSTKDAKQKYRGVFETQKSGNKISSGVIGVNISTLGTHIKRLWKGKAELDKCDRGKRIKLNTILVKRIGLSFFFLIHLCYLIFTFTCIAFV